MMSLIRAFWMRFLNSLFKQKKDIKIGLYGPPNAGKTTLANRICMDWLGEEMGIVSPIAHETREIQIKEQVTINKGNKSLTFSLVDTPGIATKIDYEEFLGVGIPEEEAKQRAKEATKGVIDSIKWLDEMDAVVVVLDSTTDPYSQVNVTILGNLEARSVPVLLVGNKVDSDVSNIKKMRQAFPQYDIVGVSALKGDNIEDFYEALFELSSKHKKEA
jgi:GTP-binding protein Era